MLLGANLYQRCEQERETCVLASGARGPRSAKHKLHQFILADAASHAAGRWHSRRRRPHVWAITEIGAEAS